MNLTYGYCRISTAKQNIDRQERNILRAYPNAKIIREVYTGTTTDRPEFDKLLKRIRPGDTIIFDSVSRMSRNAEEGYELYEKLYNEDVNLIFLKEPTINTDTYRQALRTAVPMTGTAVDKILSGVNEFLKELEKNQIRVAFDQAQKEIDDLHQRTREGIETARRNGKQIGRPIGATVTVKKAAKIKDQIRKYSKDFDGTLKDTEVMKLIGNVSRVTYYKYKKELRNYIETTKAS
ncbi:recombinase family protein [Bilifractor sp. LCP19S3_H10]|uniref:recombinase family protein n=1 Tax=Bilifractor sp. LCP19S3_H10 TaxID=3438736 RepID=UPI003F90F2EA|nr:recombinase family protein [Eubacterium sp.]